MRAGDRPAGDELGCAVGRVGADARGCSGDADPVRSGATSRPRMVVKAMAEMRVIERMADLELRRVEFL